MKTIQHGLLVSACWLLAFFICLSPASAAVQTFHAKGEYTMSDYETPSVAEERAFAYAKRSAAEQAGVYVASYTKSTGAQISEDRVNMLAGTLLQVKNKTAHKEAMANGDVHIIVEIDADMDTSQIDKSLRQEKDKRADISAMYDELQKNIARQEKENEELKQKIAVLREKRESAEELVRESKAKEREFLSLQKSDEANRYYEENRLDEALAVSGEAIYLNPKNVLAYYIRGIIYYDNGQYDQAIGDFTRVIAIMPNTYAYNNRGVVYNAKGQYNRAIDDFNHAISFGGNDENAYYNQGISYNQTGQYDRAIENFNRVIAINPNNSYAYNNRGLSYNGKGQYDQAFEDFNRAIANDSNNEVAYVNRGNTYFNNREYDRAIADYSRAIELDPKDARTYFKRGLVYSKKKQHDWAIADYSHAIELDPKDAMAYSNRGAAYFNKGQYRRAAEDFRRALSLDPGNQIYKDNLQAAITRAEGR